MHEASIADSIVNYLLDYEEKHAFLIEKVTLEIGKLSGVNTDSLSFCLDAISKTLGKKWIFSFIEKPLRFQCGNCLFEFEAEGFDSICRKCGSLKLNTVSGFEMNIFELEGEEIESKDSSIITTGK